MRIIHGLYKHPLHVVWRSMRNRCKNSKYSQYKDYGGRGIKVCERWDSFKTFYEDVIEGYSQGLQLDRINNDGNYEPTNIRWVTRQQSLYNKRKGKLNSTSKYKGVYFESYTKKWRATIKKNGKMKFLGRFLDEEEAAKAYDQAAIQEFGEYAYLNFSGVKHA